jgi:predicted transcriptional regulator
MSRGSLIAERQVLHIEISSPEESLRQFSDVWHRAEQGEDGESYYRVGFESMAELVSTLTPKRWELIKRLHHADPMTIYALAKLLQRNYKNVYADVRALSKLEVIQKTQDGKITIPFLS